MMRTFKEFCGDIKQQEYLYEVTLNMVSLDMTPQDVVKQMIEIAVISEDNPEIQAELLQLEAGFAQGLGKMTGNVWNAAKQFGQNVKQGWQAAQPAQSQVAGGSPEFQKVYDQVLALSQQVKSNQHMQQLSPAFDQVLKQVQQMAMQAQQQAQQQDQPQQNTTQNAMAPQMAGGAPGATQTTTQGTTNIPSNVAYAQ